MESLISQTVMQEQNYTAYSVEQLANDYDNSIAQQITDVLLSSGLISSFEYEKLTILNRKAFSPLLADIMPNPLDKSCE